MSKIEKIGIKATDYPDNDYFIDRLLDVAEKLNEVIEVLNTTSNFPVVQRIHGLKTDGKYVIEVPPQATLNDRRALSELLDKMGIENFIIVPFLIKIKEKE